MTATPPDPNKQPETASSAHQTQPNRRPPRPNSSQPNDSRRKPQHHNRQRQPQQVNSLSPFASSLPTSADTSFNATFGRRYGWLLGILVTTGFLLYWLGAILTPFLFGAILAYITNPIVNWLERKGISRTLGAIAVLLGLALLIILFTLILLPLIQKEALILLERLPRLGQRLQEQLIPWLNEHLGTHLQLNADTARNLVSEHMAEIQTLLKNIVSSITSGGAAVLTFLASLFLMPVVMFFQLRDWPHFLQRLDHLIPRAWHSKTQTIMQEIDAVLAEFLRGQISVMAALAAYYSLGLWLAGLEYAIPIGLITGLLIFIPYLGYGLGFLLALSAGLIDFSGWNLLLFIGGVYLLGQLLESFLLTPWLVGERIGLHPLAVIFALLAFGQIFGFVGILFALPASAALLVTLRHLRHSYLSSTFYRGRN